MEIVDLGLGFDMEEQRGLGLISMVERARLVNGTVKIHSELGKGTTVRVDVPVKSDARS
jgi:signal transduction histidine kinase